MLRFFGVSRIRKICIAAVDYVDFKKVDSAIQHDGLWLESYPMHAGISVPKERFDEIMAKLKLHDGITAVGGELTPCGEKVHAELLKRFESVNPPRNK